MAVRNLYDFQECLDLWKFGSAIEDRDFSLLLTRTARVSIRSEGQNKRISRIFREDFRGFSAKVERTFPMTWTETFHCEICGKQKGSVDHWWLAWTENYRAPYHGAPDHPILKIYPWENMSAHDAEVKHLCGQACLQTLVARWMNRTISVVHGAKASA